MKKFTFRYISVFQLALLFIIQINTQGGSGKGTYVSGRNNIPTQVDGQISISQQLKIDQRQKYRRTQQTVAIDTRFKDFLFTVQGVQDFLLNIPVAQQVALNMFTYVMIQNAYMRPKNVENQPPIKIFVYQNNNRLIYQSDFYFQNYIVFQGQQLSTYTIRFINSGSQKLIAMNLKKVTQTNQLQKLLDESVAQTHATQAGRLLDQLKFVLNAFERYTMINFQAIKALLNNINMYYYWHIFQTGIAIIVCVVQVFVIRNICKQQSIV